VGEQSGGERFGVGGEVPVLAEAVKGSPQMAAPLSEAVEAPVVFRSSVMHWRVRAPSASAVPLLVLSSVRQVGAVAEAFRSPAMLLAGALKPPWAPSDGAVRPSPALSLLSLAARRRRAGSAATQRSASRRCYGAAVVMALEPEPLGTPLISTRRRRPRLEATRPTGATDCPATAP